MTRTIQFRRYANTVTANTTGADGELILDETNHTITVHNGSTPGGTRLATETMVKTYNSGSSNVASLPNAITSGINARLFVIDSTSNTFYTIVTGGGSIKVPVFSDGTNWRIG